MAILLAMNMITLQCPVKFELWSLSIYQQLFIGASALGLALSKDI